MLHLNEGKLRRALLYAIRPSRPENTPKLQGLYLFGPKDAALARQQTNHTACSSNKDIVSSQGAQIGALWNAKSEDALAQDVARNSDKWFGRTGKLYSRPVAPEWAQVLQACHGIISFDAVLCAGPSHSASSEKGYPNLPLRVATHALDGCVGCNKAPEGLARQGHSSFDRMPLLAPPVLHSSTTRAAKTPPRTGCEKRLLVRCMDCLRTRYCESCHKWWCEDCYEVRDRIYPFIEDMGAESSDVKVHMDLCVENCLVAEMMSGAGSNGMWG